jgi:hypothetical protein
MFAAVCTGRDWGYTPNTSLAQRLSGYQMSPWAGRNGVHLDARAAVVLTGPPRTSG